MPTYTGGKAMPGYSGGGADPTVTPDETTTAETAEAPIADPSATAVQETDNDESTPTS